MIQGVRCYGTSRTMACHEEVDRALIYDRMEEKCSKCVMLKKG